MKPNDEAPLSCALDSQCQLFFQGLMSDMSKSTTRLVHSGDKEAGVHMCVTVELLSSYDTFYDMISRIKQRVMQICFLA